MSLFRYPQKYRPSQIASPLEVKKQSLSGATPISSKSSNTIPTSSLSMSDPHPNANPKPTINGSNPDDPSAATAATTAIKRQRRPSVRLGYIGEQPAASDPNLHRPKLIRLPLAKSPNPRFPKRTRTLRPKEFEGHEEDDDEGFRSESSGPANWNEDDRQNGNFGLDEEFGVRSWLNKLGLGRYAPVFEIHEVDDEVLPMLTQEDLKDMGINAVGSRRKMFCAIQKLKKEERFDF